MDEAWRISKREFVSEVKVRYHRWAQRTSEEIDQQGLAKTDEALGGNPPKWPTIQPPPSKGLANQYSRTHYLANGGWYTGDWKALVLWEI